MKPYIVPHGGQRIDQIAKAMLQTEQLGSVEAVLKANPGLAALGAIIPEGMHITPPVAFKAETTQAVVLPWGVVDA